ncbi:class I SAM-dependent methyltransferase [Sulfuriflexus mobilis]|uniref:class I SAM-dependent methyltransferase n=1 Tax=Sulfuriflexus mobilis TaxID=1811807 RepID=UPI000F816FB2|nr:class I SAM-dependent methyltransferase [Sulfuriflexus mobilis]
MSAGPSYLSRLFITLASLPLFKSRLWRWWYNLLARHDKAAELLFMNYGYAEEQDGGFVLQPADMPYRYSIQLYRHVLEGVEVEGKDVAEVGSGRGGGASWLARYLKPHHVTAIDLSPEAIAFCNAHYHLQQLSFRQGSADALPLPAGSQDVILNVESSHCYPDMAAFIAEVRRVLRPGGVLAFCDLRAVTESDALIRLFRGSGLVLEVNRDISAYVLRALERMSDERKQAISQRVPSWLHAALEDFVALKGTVLYEGLRSGDIVYMSCLLRKPGQKPERQEE